MYTKYSLLSQYPKGLFLERPWITKSTDPQVKLKESEVAQSCLTLCVPMDCSLPGSSVHGIFQARILGWGAISFSRGSSQPRDWTWVSLTVDRHFTIWAIREVIKNHLPMQGTWVRSLGWEVPWRRKWKSTPGLLPGKSHGQRSLVGYSPWGRKESDTTERLHY